jgi:hypothetical protein
VFWAVWWRPGGGLEEDLRPRGGLGGGLENAWRPEDVEALEAWRTGGMEA